MRPTALLRALAVVLLLLVAACGDDGETTTAADSSTSSTDSTSTSVTSESSDTTATSASTGTTVLAGEPSDFGPRDGATLAVVSVRFDDELNVRAGPGVDQAVVTTLEPTGTAVATGRNRLLDDGAIWSELRAGDVTGWANRTFLSQPGAVSDVTSEVIATLGERPVEPTMEDLGRRVVASRIVDGNPEPEVTIVVAPSTGDLGEVTFDAIGYADDSLRGERLHVFGTPDGTMFVLKSVEATVFCDRGVTDDGLCL